MLANKTLINRSLNFKPGWGLGEYGIQPQYIVKKETKQNKIKLKPRDFKPLASHTTNNNRTRTDPQSPWIQCYAFYTSRMCFQDTDSPPSSAHQSSQGESRVNWVFCAWATTRLSFVKAKLETFGISITVAFLQACLFCLFIYKVPKVMSSTGSSY